MSRQRKDGDSIFEKRDADILGVHTEVQSKKARANFSKMIKAARYENESVVITEHGEPAAALVPIKDLKVLDALDNLGLLNRVRGRTFKDLTIADLKALIEGDGHDAGGKSASVEEHSKNEPNRRNRSR